MDEYERVELTHLPFLTGNSPLHGIRPSENACHNAEMPEKAWASPWTEKPRDFGAQIHTGIYT